MKQNILHYKKKQINNYITNTVQNKKLLYTRYSYIKLTRDLQKR